MVGTTISILEAPPFCHGSARSCPTTSFFNNFGFAEYYQVGHITAYKGVLGTNLVSGERTTSCVVCASVEMLRHDKA